jgi:hypothetical protein
VKSLLPFLLLLLASPTRAGEFGPPHWDYVDASAATPRVPAGWYVVRTDARGLRQILPADQPGGKLRPTIRQTPSVKFPSVKSVANYGIDLGHMQAPPPGGEIRTNDPALGKELMEELNRVEQPCPGPGPCPAPRPRPRPEPEPEPEPEPDDDWTADPLGLEQYRPYIVPGACAVAVLCVLVSAFRNKPR